MIGDKKAMAIASAHPPYIKHPDSVRSMMADMLIALTPAVIWGIFRFGLRALAVMLISVGVSVAAEALFDHLTKRRITAGDLSAVVTGLILAMLMPSDVPLYVPALGALFAIVIVKCAFGGLGCNILNPALGGYVFLKLCFPSRFTLEGDPLVSLKAGEIPGESLYDMLVGNISGGIGEVSTLLLLAGGIYLIIRGTIDWRIPVAFIGTVAAVTLVFPLSANSLSFMEYELLSGALFLTAIFAATDPVTTPVKRSGRFVFGLLCGGLTIALRYYGAEPDGTAFAVLTMNLLTPIIDRLSARVRAAEHDKHGGTAHE